MDNSNAPVVLAAFSYEMEAGVLINALERCGIRAKSSGEMVAGVSGRRSRRSQGARYD